MAVDLHQLEMKSSREGGDENRTNPEPPETATCVGDEAAAAEASALVVYKKGAWSKEEDDKLRRAVDRYGLRNWVAIEKFSGLGRPAKNCRLRWLNYLRPNLKKYPFTQEEEELIFQLHTKYGNSWSRIASKLPGRSDNEIKNFWHKKAKKRHKHKKYSENQSDAPKRDEHSPQNGNVPTNYPEHTLSSTSIHSPQIQPSTPTNGVYVSFRLNDASVHSPQIAISTPLQFHHSLPAPSHDQQQSPTNQFIDQTTPTSQTQNLLLSPHPRTQSTETSFSIPNTCVCSNEFTMMREPPILSTPHGPLRRFSRAASKLSTNPSHSLVNATPSPILPLESSMQFRFPSAIESPGSPLKLKLSPRIPSQNMNTQTTDSQVASFPAFSKQSPNTAPLSPLKLRLSIPMPPDSYLQSNLSIADSTTQLGSSSTAAVISLSSSGLNLSSSSQDSPIIHDSTQTIKTGALQVESDGSFEIMRELREAQAKVRFLKKKLRLKENPNKRSLLNGNLETTDLAEGPLEGESSESTTKECTTKNLLDDVSRVEAPSQGSRKSYTLKKISRKNNLIMDVEEVNKLCELQKKEDTESKNYTRRMVEAKRTSRDENSETKTMPKESFQREEYSLVEIFKRENLITSQSTDLFDALNIQDATNPLYKESFGNRIYPFQGPAPKCSNEYPTVDGLCSKSSTLLHDNTLRGINLFSQTSSQGHVPLTGAFNLAYSQSSATTLVKSGDKIIRSSYLQPDQGEYFDYTLGQEISDNLERELTEDDGFIDGSNMGVKSLLCESNLLLNQYTSSDQLDSNSLVSTPVMEHEYFRSGEFSLQSSSCRNMPHHELPSANMTDNIVDTGYLMDFEQECPRGELYFLQSSDELDRETEKQEPCREQSMMLIDNLWQEDHVVSQNQAFSTNRYLSGVFAPTESKNWNDEPGCGYAGDVLNRDEEHDHLNTMSEDLSSLLDFFPTTSQTLEWYYNNIGNAIHDTKASDEFDMGVDLQRSSTSQPPLTTADYL
ncbi:hypothetical protein OROGR_012420 [Orobanche gracilis]